MATTYRNKWAAANAAQSRRNREQAARDAKQFPADSDRCTNQILCVGGYRNRCEHVVGHDGPCRTGAVSTYEGKPEVSR